MAATSIQLSTPIETILEITIRDGIGKALKQCGIRASVFYEYLSQYPEQQEKYSRALKARTELFVDEIIEIADTEVDPHTARNRILARQWYASKMNAKVYGEKLDLNVTQTVDIKGALTEATKRSTRVIEALPVKALPSASEAVEDLF